MLFMAKADIKTYQTKDFTIKINRTECIGCGTCSALAPKTFELDGKMICQVKNEPHDPSKIILEAAQSCATDAITIIDKKTGKKLWPK